MSFYARVQDFGVGFPTQTGYQLSNSGSLQFWFFFAFILGIPLNPKELMDMMFDLSYSVSGEDEPFKMKFNEVIFVMEDVDCASKAWTALAQFGLLPSVYDHLQKMVALGEEMNKLPAALPFCPFFSCLNNNQNWFRPPSHHSHPGAGGLCPQGRLCGCRGAGRQHVGGARPGAVARGRRRHVRPVVPRGLGAGDAAGPGGAEAQRAVLGAADVATGLQGGLGGSRGGRV